MSCGTLWCWQLLRPCRDWKKLTFYYFADEYINFNSLVTDLFKIYKTRIWMSAINPASFQTPAGGLQIPGGVVSSGPSIIGTDLEQYPNPGQRRQHQVPAPAGAVQPIQSNFDHSWQSSRDGNAISNMAFQQLYGRTFPGHELDVREDQYPLDHRQGFPQMFSMGSPFNPLGYNVPNLNNSTSFTSRPGSSNAGAHPSQVPSQDWNQSFQGLSLGH